MTLAGVWDVSTWDPEVWITILIALLTALGALLRGWVRSPERRFRRDLRKYRRWFATTYGYLSESGTSDSVGLERNLDAFVRLSVVDANIENAVRADAFEEFNRRIDPHSRKPVHLFVLGRPGSGKSTLLRAYGVDQVRAGGLTSNGAGTSTRTRLWSWVGRSRHIGWPRRIPILVELADFAAWLQEGMPRQEAERELVRYLTYRLTRMGLKGPVGATVFLRRALKTESLDLLLDGLDEVRAPLRDSLLWAVRGFCSNYDLEMPTAKARLLVSCRSENFDVLREHWRREPVVSAELQLLPLRDAEVHDYIHRIGRGRWDRAWGQRFLEAMRDRGTIDLVRYPLILARAVDHYEQGGGSAVPGAVTEFYDRMIRELLARTNRGVPGRDRLELDEMLAVLEALADSNARGSTRGASAAFRYFTRSDLVDVCRDHRHGWQRNLDDGQVEQCADRLIQRSGLIMKGQDTEPAPRGRRTEEPHLYFAHRSFHEYLVSVHLARNRNEGAEYLTTHVDNDEWHLVIQFFAAQLKPPASPADQAAEADQFLMRMVAESDRRPTTGDPGAAGSALTVLALAGNCLAWSRPSDATATEITARLYRTIADEISWLTLNRGAANALIHRRRTAAAKAINALLAGLRSPREGVRESVRPKAEQLIGELDRAMAGGLDLRPDAAVMNQMIDGIAKARNGQAIGPVAGLVRLAPQHSELVGPLWRCLQAYAMTPESERTDDARAARIVVEKLLTLTMIRDGFEELDAQPPLRRTNGVRNGTAELGAAPVTSMPAFMTEQLVREAYPFANGLPRHGEVHPMVALLCWAHHLGANPTPRNRFMEAKRQPAAFSTVERDRRRTTVAVSFWVARVWTTVVLLVAVAWIALLTAAPSPRRAIGPNTWVWALLGAVLAVVLYVLATRPEPDPPRSRRGLRRRLLDAGAAPQQGESGSVIPEVLARLLPESLAQMAIVIVPVGLALPILWTFGAPGIRSGLVVLAIGLLAVWIPASRAFDHGKGTHARNPYLDIYDDPDSILWIVPRDRIERARKRQSIDQVATDGHSGVDMRTWLLAATPKMVFGGIVFAAVALALGYRNVPFDPSAMAVAIGALVLVVVVHAYARFRQLETPEMLRLLLGVVGGGFVVTGLLLMGYGEERLGVRGLNGLGAAAVFGGALVLYCMLHLRTEFDQITDIPRPIESGTRSGNGVEAALQRFQTSGSAGGIEREVGICLEYLALKDLHYVAYYVGGRIRFSIDLLDNDILQTEFSDHPVEAQVRRRQYLSHGPRLFRLVGRFNEQFKTIESGDLLRVVLDVERGALYYFFVDTDNFLIGVTLDQYQVHETDRKLVNLVTALRKGMGKLPIEELEGPVRWSASQASAMEPV